jgi:hypothetical protein
MLFTDSPAIAIEDLADHETVILDTASTEGINLTVKIGLATTEVGLELQSRFPQLGPVNIALVTPGLLGLATFKLNNVVVTPALRLWLIFHTLEIVYRDAYHNQLNDRYKAKWDEYKDLSSFASGLLFRVGVGTVVNSIPQAAHPRLSLVGGSLAPAKYFVQIAWRNANGEEGGPSELTALDVPGGNTLQVMAVRPPSIAISWNVYAGASPDSLFLQNPSPLDPSASWTAPSSGLLTSGPQPGTGQQPTFLNPAPRILLRG